MPRYSFTQRRNLIRAIDYGLVYDGATGSAAANDTALTAIYNAAANDDVIDARVPGIAGPMYFNTPLDWAAKRLQVLLNGTPQDAVPTTGVVWKFNGSYTAPTTTVNGTQNNLTNGQALTVASTTGFQSSGSFNHSTNGEVTYSSKTATTFVLVIPSGTLSFTNSDALTGFTAALHLGSGSTLDQVAIDGGTSLDYAVRGSGADFSARDCFVWRGSRACVCLDGNADRAQYSGGRVRGVSAAGTTFGMLILPGGSDIKVTGSKSGDLVFSGSYGTNIKSRADTTRFVNVRMNGNSSSTAPTFEATRSFRMFGCRIDGGSGIVGASTKGIVAINTEATAPNIHIESTEIHLLPGGTDAVWDGIRVDATTAQVRGLHISDGSIQGDGTGNQLAYALNIAAGTVRQSNFSPGNVVWCAQAGLWNARPDIVGEFAHGYGTNRANTKYTKASGVASVADGGTITFPLDGFIAAPRSIHVTSANTTTTRFVQVTAVTATTATVRLRTAADATVGAAENVYWIAEV